MTGQRLLTAIQLRIERQTVHHSRFDTDLLNWREYYSKVGHRPDRIERTAIRVAISPLMDAA